ncbi:MAG TPA: hypothetical protein VMM56_07990 [Planctomycetaceae bacterium]|nr:hypothetical protein [Planctomycetaceae bacterium]
MTDSLIISWEQHRLVLLSGSASGSEVRVEKFIALDWPSGTDPRENRSAAALFLKGTLRENGLTADSAVVSLPREAVVLRHLPLPDLPDDELPEIVKLQAATKSAVPPDQLLIDFLPLPGKNAEGLRPVMIATIDRKNADTIRETLRSAGLSLAGVVLESVGLAEIASRTATPDYGKTLLAISQTGHRLELLFLQNNSLMMMHTAVLAEGADLDKALIAEINRATIATEQKIGTITIGEVVLFSDAKFESESLKSRYGNHFQRVDLANSAVIQLAGSIKGADISTTIGALSGLLLNKAQGRISGLDFVNPRRQAVVKDDRLRKYGLYAAAGLTVVAIGLYAFFSYRGKLNTAIADLKTTQADLQELMKQEAPTLKSNQILTDWQDRDLDLLAELDEVQSTLPGTGLAYLEQFYFDVTLTKDIARYSAKGVATDPDVVYGLYADFGKSGFAVEPKEIKSGRDPEYPTVFDLVMNRQPKAVVGSTPAKSQLPPQAIKP